MNDAPPDPDPPDDIDDMYRRAAALDTSRPSEFVGRSVLEHAARVAEQRRATTGMPRAEPPAHRARWRPALVGTLAAAALAGLLVTPHFLEPRHAPARVSVAQFSAPPATIGMAQSSKLVPAPPNVSPSSAVGSRPPSAAARGRSVDMFDMAAQSRTSDSEPPVPPAPGALSAKRIAPNVPAAISNRPQTSLEEPASALRRAAQSDDLVSLEALLGRQIAVDARDADGRSALLLATLAGHGQAVDLLLAHGADANAADAHGLTPLQAALAANQPDIVAALRRAGAQ